MTDMDDWETAMEDTGAEKVETKDDKAKIVIESEEYVPVKKERPVQVVQDKGEDSDDPDVKYNRKFGKYNELKKEEEKALEGLDERTKAKKREEKQALQDALEFIGGNKKVEAKANSESKPVVLKIEKDFIDFAISNVAKVKDAKLPSKFTMTYLKQNIDLLGPSLESEKIDTLIKSLTVMFNQKRKDENDKSGKVKKIKYSQKGGKISDKLDQGPVNYNDEEDYANDEDYDDDAFM